MASGKRTSSRDDLPPFEKAVEELESIVERIETGDVDLEQSLAIFERGTRLVAHCRKILDQAQKKIRELTLKDDGRLAVEADMEEANDQ